MKLSIFGDRNYRSFLLLLLCMQLYYVAHAEESRHSALDPTKHPPTDFYVDGERPPGTLILIMVVKDEAETLNKTLPRWAKVIDYYVIGVDDNNTDSTYEVIEEHLGHIPGLAMEVHFDGMGPTYTEVIRKGWQLFPEGTHGIMADADYAPVSDDYDKSNLDIHASKMLFRLYSDGAKALSQYRMMDWIYRNSPGVYVSRRTHQILVTKPNADSGGIKVMMSGFDVEETGPGYQDRTMSRTGKFFRYIDWLHKDLDEYPDDPRTLYYLGDSYKGAYMSKLESGNVTASDKWLLQESLKWYYRSWKVEGNFEETYFTLVKLGEINERFYANYKDGFFYYSEAVKHDPERADAIFYIGQRLFLRGKIELAVKALAGAARLPLPQRSVFQWVELYDCGSKVLFAEAVAAATRRGRMDEDTLLDYAEEAVELLKNAVEGKTLCLAHGKETEYQRGLRAKTALERYLHEVASKGYGNVPIRKDRHAKSNQ